MPLSFIVADDHPIFRLGVVSLIKTVPDYRVLGEAGNGRAVLDLVEKIRPNFLILDLMMPELNGMDVIAQVCHHKTRTRVIVLTMQSKEEYIVGAVRKGASAYLLKDTVAEELLDAVQAVSLGKIYLSRQIDRRAVELSAQSNRESLVDLYETLTRREREVLHLIVDGLTNADVAKKLSISERTVEVHRLNMMHKLNLENFPDLVKFAIRRGIIDET